MFARTLLILTILSSSAFASVLVKSIHHTSFDLKAGEDSVSIWLPLPADYFTQTPLAYSIEVFPTSLKKKFQYSQDDIGNRGVLIQFDSDQSAKNAFIHGEFLTLIHNNLGKDRNDFIEVPHAPQEWLQSTAVVSSTYGGISKQAQQLKQQSKNVVEYFENIQKWFKKDFTYGALKPYGLDAVTAFEDKKTTCTGFANLAAAMGRAILVPTRTLAGYAIGVTQQTHAVNEYYLPTWGWQRIEPQLVLSWLPEDYFLLVRINRTVDEGVDALEPQRPGRAAKGLPLLSLLEVNGETKRIENLSSNYFPESPGSDNKAIALQRMTEDPQEEKRIFFLARDLWKKDWDILLNGGTPPQNTINNRSKFETAKSLSDLNTILIEISKN